MNVIVTNKYQSIIQGLEIDVIREMHGEFEIDEIVSSFQNFFFQRMILDITAIKNYQDIKNLQKLSISLDMDKVILFLGDVPEGGDGGTGGYISQLISLGIYNFTKNLEGIMYLYNNPNSYRDVAHFHQLRDETVTQTERHISSPTFMQTRVIGIENVTNQTGATTLIYMMKRELAKNYSVVGVEVNKRDFSYFNDKDLLSTSDNEVHNVLNSVRNNEVILVDINGSVAAEGLCSEVIYLIEPSIIKLNKLMVLNRKKLDKIKDKKVILNQSLLNSKDVLDFEYESKIKIFFNMPPLDERQGDINILNIFLQKLGFERQKTEEVEKKSKILGLFNL